MPSDIRHGAHTTILIVIRDVEQRFPIEVTSSDHRAEKNARRDLRNAGLIIETDPPKFVEAVQQKLNTSDLDWGDISGLLKALDTIPSVKIPAHAIGGIEVPGFNCGLTVIFDEDEHELLIDHRNSHGYGAGSLVHVTLSETNTMKPEAMLALRREISTEIGLDFSQDQKRLLESWQNLNNDGFDLFSKMCDN